MSKFEYSSVFACGVEELFSYHERKGVLYRLIPPWEDVVVLKDPEDLVSSRAEFIVTIAPFLCFKWIAEHTGYIRNKQFKDIQLSGPFRKWEHTHLFEYISEIKSKMIDSIEFEPMFSTFSSIFAEKMIYSKLEKTFRYRHTVTANDLDFLKKIGDVEPISIAIAGSNGLIGRELVPFLRLLGHNVFRIVRQPSNKENEIYFDIDNAELKNVSVPLDIIINLAGEPISEGLWTDKKLKAIHDSRVVFTKNLIIALSKLKYPVKYFMNASAIGFYGDSKDSLNEKSPKGSGFIADLCEKWEESAKNDLFPTAILRIGVVLSPKGGALKQLVRFANFNLGATLGKGEQYISWISIDDLIYSLVYILYNRLEGVFNLVSPSPSTQKEMIDLISKKLKRLRFLSLGEKSVKMIYGKLGEEVLLSSSFVLPEALSQSGYKFYFPSLNATLNHLLGVRDE